MFTLLTKRAPLLLTLMLLCHPLQSNDQRFEEPIYTPEQIEKMAIKYIKSSTEIDLEEYYLKHLNFVYTENYFHLGYRCKIEVTVGCHFSLRITNEAQAEFKFSGGR